MWKLFNFLFGWDYIYWEDYDSSGIARIYDGFNGCPWFFQYKIIKVIKEIKRADEVIWLTCKSSKYLKEN